MSPPPGSAPRPMPGPQLFADADEQFAGLLHFDGTDAKGRPVIIVNARAAAVSNITLRPLAVQYMMQRLDPIVYAVCPAPTPCIRCARP